MAIVLIEGFDHFSKDDAVEKGWTGNIFGMTAPRGFGGQSMDVIINNEVRKILPSSYATIIAGAALRVDDTLPGTIMTLRGGGVPAVSVASNGGNRLLEIIDSAGAVVASGTTLIPIEEFFYVELKLVVGTAGHATVHLNGQPEIAATLGNYGSSNIDTIEFSNHSLSGNTHVDDVVVLDTTGSAPQNDFLGDVRVQTLWPVSDASHLQWTPDSGTAHYSRVNETLIDDDASYVITATPGNKDSYKMDTYLSTIYSAQLSVGARKGESASRQIAPLVKQAGTDHLGSTSNLTIDYSFYSWILDRDLASATWTPTTVNANEFGQELIT